MAKKMSIEEILAAARANKGAGGATPAPKAEEKPTEPAAEAPASEPAEEPAGEAPAAAPAKVAPGGKGMSMAEILAAARAGKGGAPKPAAPKPAAEKPAAKPAAPAAEKKPIAEKKPGPPAVTEKDTASILAAARKGAKPGPTSKAEAAKTADPAAAGKPAKAKIEVPPMPARPAFRPAPAAAADGTSRRTFLASFGVVGGYLFGSGLAVGFTTLAATTVAWTLGLARFMFPNILIEPPTRFKVGFPDNLGPGQVETKFIPQFGVWVVKYEFEGQPMIYALKSVCTHLGCTPNWLEAEQKFKCPCHGSGFYKDGVNFEGPAPRPLERYAISIADDGQLEVDKSRTFNQETGQWADPASFVPV